MEGIIKIKICHFWFKMLFISILIDSMLWEIEFRIDSTIFHQNLTDFHQNRPNKLIFCISRTWPKTAKNHCFFEKKYFFSVFSIFRWFLPPQSRQKEYEKPDFRCFKLKNIMFIETSISETWFLAQNPIHPPPHPALFYIIFVYF